MLAGMPVEFELLINRDGKFRTERLWLLEPLDRGPPVRGLGFDRLGFRKGFGGKDAGKGLRDGGRGARDGPPPPDLDERTVQEMTKFLEEKGGAMDHGKFANAFPGVKKSQLEPHFILVPEGITSGGRWQVMLPGVDPLTPEERAAREHVAGETRTPRNEPIDPPLALEPSDSLRLIGCVKKWDQKRGYGFVVADGADDVFLHRSDLPPEVRAWRGDFKGAEMTFMLGEAEDGKLKAVDVHLLLVPDEEGRWQLRRIPLDDSMDDGEDRSAEREDQEDGEQAAEKAVEKAVEEAVEDTVEEATEPEYVPGAMVGSHLSKNAEKLALEKKLTQYGTEQYEEEEEEEEVEGGEKPGSEEAGPQADTA